MKLVANEKTLPRIHLCGTLAITLLLTLLLAAVFSWQSFGAQRDALRRIEEVADEQIRARLHSEMDSALGAIDFTRSRAEEQLRRSLVNQVDAAMAIAQAIQAREAGHRPASEVQRMIIETLRPARFFEGRGYLFINDLAGYYRLLPTAPELEGRDNRDNRDDQGRPVMGTLIEAARRPRGEGFARYRWYTPDNPRQMEDKLSYVRQLEPYGWMIGAGDYLHYWESYQQREALDRLRATRFGRTGYIVASSLDGRALLMPALPELEGRHLSEMPALTEAALDKITRSAQSGGGIVSYDWPDPVSGQNKRKTALVRIFQPWGWVLTVTMFDEELLAAVKRELGQQKLLGREQAVGLAVALAAALTLGLLASLAFSRWSGVLFREYHQRNLEQQQALREGESKLNTILDSVDAAIYIKDIDLRYRYANRLACELIGHPLSQIVGQTDETLLDARQAARTQALARRALEGGERVAGEWVLERDGRARTFAQVKLPLRDAGGMIYGLCGIVTDISELKHAEASMAAARDAAEAASRAKADFIAKISHELRTPMNAILGMLHLAQQTSLSAQQQGYLQQVKDASRQLLAIIDDMLDFSSLDGGSLELASVDFTLAEVLDQLAARVAAAAADKGLELGVTVAAEVPQRLRGEPQRLLQMLLHYADNAIKFTERGSVQLSAGLVRDGKPGLCLRFEVRDTGIGLSREQREQLFCSFHQADSSATRRYGGAGLGLVLVKQLAALMGGAAGCESEPGRGSTFWFTARFEPVAEPPAPPSQTQRSPYRWTSAPAIAAGPAPCDDARWPALRERLLLLLREDNVDSVQLFEEHEGLLRQGLGERYLTVAQAVRSYDFPAALAALEQQ
ncbi:MAG: hypothetical protein RJA36_200 [Pseudomonadota bacterium]|jgi:PAS domain S-box-containing protein